MSGDVRGSGPDPLALKPLLPGGGRQSPWLAVGAVAVLLIGLILVGRFGGGLPSPSRSPAATVAARSTSPAPPSATRGTRATSAAATPSEVRPTPTPTATAETLSTVFVDPYRYGFILRASTAVRDDPAETGAWSVRYNEVTIVRPRTAVGSIVVSVGTQAAGAALDTPASGTVFARSSAALEVAYRAAIDGTVAVSQPATIDREPARLLSVQPTAQAPQWTALVTHAGRAYVITARGIQSVPGWEIDPARAGLTQFLQRFQFYGDAVYDNDPLGFEAVSAAEPIVTLQRTTPATGRAILWGEPQWGADRFFVSVGSKASPVSLTLPGPFGDPRRTARLWAPTLDGVRAQFEAAFGPPRDVEPRQVSGLPALLFRDAEAYGSVLVVLNGARLWVASADPQSVVREEESDQFLQQIQLLGTASVR